MKSLLDEPHSTPDPLRRNPRSCILPAISTDHRIRRAATQIVNLVLSEDYAYLDALPDAVEIEIVTPLSAVGQALNEGTPHELVRAVRLFLSCALPMEGEMPADLAAAVTELRFSLTQPSTTRL
ncbi:hypothetical protein ACIPRL_36410 [Streptomyces sp. NPDC090085]|uniref:hypothetical protein n=1 Tax=Streptomyces sp. NPDC090085 TaxID=3365943 RepID=UPI0037F5C3CB